MTFIQGFQVTLGQEHAPHYARFLHPSVTSDLLGPNILISTLFSTCRLLLLLSYLAYISTLKMEAICFCETSGSLQTAQRYNTEGHKLHSHSREFTVSYT
jgi:hypothetical protein